MALLIIGGAIIAALVLFVVFFMMRSTKEMPTNIQDFIAEVKVQLGGGVALTEDILMRSINKVGK
jgi:predicted PurR-regulated permease PerM